MLLEWKFKGLSNKNIEFSNINLVQSIVFFLLKVARSCLKHDKVTFLLKAIVNLYTVYQTTLCPYYLCVEFTIGNCLFGAVTLTKNADKDKYGKSGYAIRLYKVMVAGLVKILLFSV